MNSYLGRPEYCHKKERQGKTSAAGKKTKLGGSSGGKNAKAVVSRPLRFTRAGDFDGNTVDEGGRRCERAVNISGKMDIEAC